MTAEEFIKSKGINIDYAKGIKLLIDPETNIIELLDEFRNLETDEAQAKSGRTVVRNFLPTDEEVGEWFDINIDNDSASSAIYKFRLWLNDRQKHL